MKTVIITCDICGRETAPEDIRFLQIDGHAPMDIDVKCMETTVNVHKDAKAWEALRADTEAKMEAEAAVKP